MTRERTAPRPCPICEPGQVKRCWLCNATRTVTRATFARWALLGKPKRLVD
jgi:hypothetical protein